MPSSRDGGDQALDERCARRRWPRTDGVDGDGADLGDVLPQRVDGAAADDAAALVGDPEVLHVLVQLHALLGEQDAVARVELDQVVDGGHVGRARAAERDVAHARRSSQTRTRASVERAGVAPDRVVRDLARRPARVARVEAVAPRDGREVGRRQRRDRRDHPRRARAGEDDLELLEAVLAAGADAARIGRQLLPDRAGSLRRIGHEQVGRHVGEAVERPQVRGHARRDRRGG